MGLYADYIFPFLLKSVDRYIMEERRYVAGGAAGRVLEIGIGRGSNLAFYTERSSEIIGVEPHARLLQTTRRFQQDLQQNGTPTPAALLKGTAESLPFPEHSFDSVVACLVFCTIPDAERAAREMFRVLKPGGRLLFFEHVRADDPALARWQARLNPLWNIIGCGCHLDRDTKGLFADAGFAYHELREYQMPTAVKVVAPVILGTALKPSHTTHNSNSPPSSKR